MKVFQCPTAFDADEQGRIKAEFQCFPLIALVAINTR
jgi:hypothetical protein